MKILLIHGLSRTPVSLMGLAKRLERHGWQSELFGYVAFLESFEQIAQRLCQTIKVLGNQGGYSIVAHSLGGLLARVALDQSDIPQPNHIVMLGTPNQRPRLAPIAWQAFPFRWFTGQCGFNLTQTNFFEDLPRLRSSYTILAGTLGPQGPLSPFGNAINDGIVAVDETRIVNSDRPILFPVEHTFMMNDKTVQATVIKTLEQYQDSVSITN